MWPEPVGPLVEVVSGLLDASDRTEPHLFTVFSRVHPGLVLPLLVMDDSLMFE